MGRRQAYYLCYATGPLELPDDYDGLASDEGRNSGCKFDATELDVFVYPAEALARRRAPVTGSLAVAEPTRRDFVVAHEDFHEQDDVRRMRPALKEAVSMLAGFLAAAEAARLRQDRVGEEQALREADLFLRKAEEINAMHSRLSDLYREARRGEVSEQQALERKAETFERLGQQCRAADSQPQTFHLCPGALNNAGLAFDFTYTREYPRVHAIWEQEGRDPRRTIMRLRSLAD